MFGQCRRLCWKIKLCTGNSFTVSLLYIKMLYMFKTFVSLLSGHVSYYRAFKITSTKLSETNTRFCNQSRLLGLDVRIPLWAWMSVLYECFLSGISLCDGPITRPEGSCRTWPVTVCDLETLKWRGLYPSRVSSFRKRKYFWEYTLGIRLNDTTMES